MKYQLVDTLTHKSFDSYYIDKRIKILIETYISNSTFHFLFFGNPYSGKTSIIDVILSQYYGTLRQDDYVLHITSLFDNGIQYFKTTLKTFCKTSITSSRKKTIVIDDIDLITENNQHVLRNYIDLYRNKINFISTCTNQRKVIETLQSRLTNIQLHNLPNDKVLYILGNLNKKHSMKFTDKHIKKIASKNDFNLNASVNVMQKIHLSDKYSDHSINENATTINYDVIQKYFTLLYNNKHHDALHILIQLYENGFSTHDIYNVFYKYFTSYDNILDINNISNKYNFLTLICKYIQNNVKIIDSKLELYFFSNDLYNETSLIQN
jgi:DNA polymerase III delta prime subunit